ncbi:MAG: cyclodeaminase/cyclohydrolase family protein [Christensenellaceae bacterium]|nr:cyclodeaminase/cyclohydrolase family protein [Christensenellaceae bacterium]
MKLIDMQVKDYLDILASDAPAPGGGSAAALCGAQGIGLTTMVAGQTVSKKRYEAEWPIAQKVIDEGKGLYEALTAQVDKDTDAYNLVAAAFKMPKETDEEKAARRNEIAKATLVATEVPFETLRLAVRSLELADTLLGHYNTNCASDLGVAVLNLYTCIHGAWLNVLINLGGVKDEERAKFFDEEGKKLVAHADELAMRIESTTTADIMG